MYVYFLWYVQEADQGLNKLIMKCDALIRQKDQNTEDNSL